MTATKMAYDVPGVECVRMTKHLTGLMPRCPRIDWCSVATDGKELPGPWMVRSGGFCVSD
ncbi:hypothetical protein [Dehalobacter restrictus]|uniref:hypothetical protein n=2 Tax=Desulfitobacteriaceae TaxID=2937909 RepID=UPI00138AADA1|nr:hypothetical protein [Dehalobacter restrictus]